MSTKVNKMSAKEYQAAIDKLELSQRRSGKLLGVNERSVRRWVEGSRPVPPFAARFLRYLIATRKSGEKAIEILDKLEA